MFGLGDRVHRLVQRWIPEKAYQHEKRFQKDLYEYLQAELNNNAVGFMAGGQQHTVAREHGRSYADIAVNGEIGIELKHDLSNSQTKKLRGQIETHRQEYASVIVCACGIEDQDGWQRVVNEYSGPQLGFGQGTVQFVHKHKAEYDSRVTDDRDTGGFEGFW
jgi:hypothetical protein